MAKAHIALTDGTKITIEGTSEEVAALVSKLSTGTPLSSKEKKRSEIKSRQSTSSKSGPVDLISELIDGGFFKKPKELGSIRLALEEQGHYYPVTTLSPLLLRLVRRKQLRRIKDKKRWLYVG